MAINERDIVPDDHGALRLAFKDRVDDPTAAANNRMLQEAVLDDGVCTEV
jgi:hypothetical protein